MAQGTRARAWRLEAKASRARALVVEQRLLAEPIAHQPEAALAAIVDRKGPLPHHAIECGRTPALPGVQEDLGIRSGAQIAGAESELLAQLGEVVDFAVERDDQPAARTRHRLAAGIAQVENREAAMSERERPFAGDPLTVGTTPLERRQHAHQRVRVVALRPEAKHPRDAAHVDLVSSPEPRRSPYVLRTPASTREGPLRLRAHSSTLRPAASRQ